MFWNCQGVRSKRKDLELYLKENDFDIIALNETLLTKKINFQIHGYDTIKSDRSTGLGGGVTFLVKHGLVVNKEYPATRFASYKLVKPELLIFRNVVHPFTDDHLNHPMI